MKNTKGPWRSDKWEIIGGDNSVVAKVIPWDASGCREEDNANAHLIAAAPDLYAVLKAIIDDLPISRDWLDPVNERWAKNALKKARGES